MPMREMLNRMLGHGEVSNRPMYYWDDADQASRLLTRHVRVVDVVGGARSVAFDPANPIPIRVYAIGDGTFALGVRERILKERVTVDGEPVTSNGRLVVVPA